MQVLDAPADSEGDTGWWPNVLFDHRNVAHIAFCDAHNGDVRYATETAAGWQVRSIFSQGAVGKYIAMDVDTQNRVGLMYYDQDKRYLHYARQSRAEGPWDDERVAWGRELGIGGALRFDNAGVPHLFYYLPAGNLVHATKGPRDADWTKSILAEVQGVYSMRTGAITRPDGVWLSYADWKMRDSALYLGHLVQDGNWDTRVVANEHGPGWRSQLVFVGDAPTVIHSQHLTTQTSVSAPTAQGNWVTRPLVSQGSSFAATVWNDKVVIAFQDTSDAKAGAAVRYTVQSHQGPWPVYTVDASSPAGGYLAAAVSAKGRLLIAYYADAERSLKLYDEQL